MLPLWFRTRWAVDDGDRPVRRATGRRISPRQGPATDLVEAALFGPPGGRRPFSFVPDRANTSPSSTFQSMPCFAGHSNDPVFEGTSAKLGPYPHCASAKPRLASTLAGLRYWANQAGNIPIPSGSVEGRADNRDRGKLTRSDVRPHCTRPRQGCPPTTLWTVLRGSLLGRVLLCPACRSMSAAWSSNSTARRSSRSLKESDPSDCAKRRASLDRVLA